MNRSLSNLILSIIAGLGCLGTLAVWALTPQKGLNLGPEATFAVFRDHYCLLKQEAINKRQEPLYSGMADPSEHKVKKVIQTMYDQVHNLANQQCLASFGLNPEVTQKIEDAFAELISEQNKNEKDLEITWGLKKIRRAVHYFGFMAQWLAKKADRFTFDQCLMLHYALSSFETMLESQQAELQPVKNREKHETLSSIEALQDQVGHMKDDIASQLINPKA